MSKRVMTMHSKRYLKWPIYFKWSKPLIKRLKPRWFAKHGWQTGWDGSGMGVFGWTLHLGRLKICFGGPDFKKKPHKQVPIPIEDR